MNKNISIVIPVFNEKESLEELYGSIKKIFKKELKGFEAEFVFINDGSTDKTLETLKRFQLKDKAVKVISFRIRLGKATALNEGFKKAKGDIIVTMDGDLQDGPENLPILYEKLSEGYDLVVGWKKKRIDPIGKTLPSRILFNFFVRKFSKLPLHDFNSGFKIMKREVISEIYLYGELHRFIPVLAAQQGFKVTEVVVTHHPRKYGNSKYTLGERIKGAFDFLTVMFLDSYGERPLHLFGILGLLSIFLGICFGFYLTVLHFQGVSIIRRPLLNLAILLIVAGLQLFSTGLIGEMIVNRFKKGERLPIEYETK